MKFKNFTDQRVRHIAILLLFLISNFVRTNAQCFEPDGVTVRPSFYSIWVAVDQSWIDLYGGNAEVARMKAEEATNAAIDKLNTSPFKTVFNVTFIRGFSPSAIAPGLPPGGDKTGWCIDINNFYRDRYPCLSFDAILLFNDKFGSFADFGFNKVGLIGGLTSPHVIAHELGHIIGLVHAENSPSQPMCCTSFKNMMCIPLDNNSVLTPVNTACGQGIPFLNTTVFTSSFCNATKNPPSFIPEDDFECPPVVNMGYSIAIDNPYPAVGCKTGDDIVTVTVTFINNNVAANRNFRVLMSEDNSGFMEFLPDPSSPFNCVKTLASGSKEFRITNTVTADCEDEVFFPLASGETKTFTFKMKYLGGFTTSSIGINPKIYTGSDPSFNFKNFIISPCIRILGGSFSSLLASNNWRTNSPLLIIGKLTMNPASTPIWGNNTYSFESNKKLLFAPGAELEVAAASKVRMPHVEIEGCNAMWKGITVKDDAILEMSMMTSIKDAQYAVKVEKGAVADIQSSKFENNDYGVNTSTAGSGDYTLTVLGNTFKTSASGLKPAYSGQSPAPGSKGFAGIYVKDFTAGLSIDKDGTFGLSNEFSNLHYGILAENTNVTVRNASFTDMPKEARPSGHQGPLFTGTGIHLTGRKVDVKGSFMSVAPDPVTMSNCYTGVNVFGGSIDAAGCEMTNMTNGIVALGGAHKSYSISFNSVSASERGISVFYQSGLAGQSSVTFNTVQMSGNANGIGIGIGGSEMFPQQEGFVQNNTITVNDGAIGIQVGVANHLRVMQNNVTLAGANTLSGIKIEGGDLNSIGCNTVLNAGGSNNDGIYAVHAGRASIFCNITDGTTRGLHFAGMLGGKNKADVGKNLMKDNTTFGLLLGTDAVIGEQRHKGNKWTGGATIARHLTPGISLSSLFVVDNNENTQFMPDLVAPQPWFLDESTPTTTDTECSPGMSCPIPMVISPTPELDRKIAKGELTGTTYHAAQLWLAQRRLYEKLTEESNPYAGDVDFANFLMASQANGLYQYGNIQIGIRQLGGMNDESRAAAASNLLTLNNNLSGTNTYQTNEKTVNEIFLQTVATGNLVFTPVQQTQLTSIANSCPLSGGEAVLRARTLLNLALETPVTYDDGTLCGALRPSEGRSSEVVSGTDQILVYPNPANDQIILDYQINSANDARVLLFNALGQVVRSVSLPQTNGQLTISVSDLNPGIYWYKLSGVGNSSLSGKIIINR